MAFAALFALLQSNAAAQAAGGDKSLAEIAREAKQAKEAKKATDPHAKIVLTDESMKVKSGALPDIPPDGVDNSDAIMIAIQEYRSKHTAEETENVIHDWFDLYDKEMANAIDENKRIESGPEDPTYISEGEYRMAMQNQRYDYKKKKENGLLMARVQNTFTRIRNDLQRQGFKYSWFKIRCGNGNCSF